MSTIEACTPGGPPHGGFCLPAIDPEIPPELDQGVRRRQILAKFVGFAAKAGVSLPSGAFTSIDQVVQAQWQQHLEQTYPTGTFGRLAGKPEVLVTDTQLAVTITSEHRLNAYRMKPVVEALEKSQPGMGWFLEDVISTASHYGHELYTMGHVSHWLDYTFGYLDELTDEAYARHLLEQEGNEVGKDSVPEATIERLRGEYSHWPSDVIEEVDGHKHLLGWASPGLVRATPAQARIWLQKHPRHAHAKTVELALKLMALFKRSDQDFVWDGQHDDSETIGAMAFIAWDHPGLLFEAVQHNEEMAYQGGMGVEAYARCQVLLEPETATAEIRRLAKATVNYMKRWALLEDLLSRLPICEGDEEV